MMSASHRDLVLRLRTPDSCGFISKVSVQTIPSCAEMEHALASSQLLAPNKCLLQRNAVPHLRKAAAHKRLQCSAER